MLISFPMQNGACLSVNGCANNLGDTRVCLMANTGTREGASVTKTIPWNVLSYLDGLSVHVVFG